MLSAIRELELPIVLVFNRSRVMALTQGISRATGLSAALGTLRKSPGNALAVGDAENDHELLRLAEVGAAVEWGSPSLRAAADIVIAGDGPAAVGDFVRQVAAAEVILVTRSRIVRRSTRSGAIASPVNVSALLPGTWTPHVRHRQKYVDVPVGAARAFVFHGNGHRGTSRAHTLPEFVMVLDELDVTHADGYLRRGDFSRWIVDVFGDHALARELQDQEREYLQSPPGEAVARIAAAIKSRYELTEENDSGVV